jgi:CspA family cold shock protein
MQGEGQKMPVGRVKWYDKSKGYGFIESPEGDVFFHFSDILMDGFKALAEDQRVSYQMFRSEQGLKAKQIRPLDNRASVRHAARYRTLIHMRICDGKQKEFDAFFVNIPAWFDAMEQDLGLRRIGTWRHENDAVHLVESDRPYEQSMEGAKDLPCWDNYQKWCEQLEELIESEPAIMSPVQFEESEQPEESEESAEA